MVKRLQVLNFTSSQDAGKNYERSGALRVSMAYDRIAPSHPPTHGSSYSHRSSLQLDKRPIFKQVPEWSNDTVANFARPFGVVKPDMTEQGPTNWLSSGDCVHECLHVVTHSGRQ
jgi:hypothetical protein